jgi:DnaJ-class molecular chaperone
MNPKFTLDTPCLKCQGTGKIQNTECAACQGKGKILTQEGRKLISFLKDSIRLSEN